MEGQSLADIFAEIHRAVKSDDKIEMVQSQIDSSVDLRSKVDSLKLFSPNETLDEISTPQIKFLLVAYFEGALRLKAHDQNPQLSTWELVTRCFLDYIRLLSNYGLAPAPLQKAADPRQARIDQYKREKTLKEQMALFERDTKEDSHDEEQSRVYWLANVELYAAKAASSMKLMRDELPLLKMRAQGVAPPPPPAPRPPTKPMIITKNEEMKRVFGLGYPSAPVFTVEEFGERQAQLMMAQQQKEAHEQANRPIDDPSREMSETEEATERRRLQRWDNHKDFTRRGDGNRKNMG